MIPPRHTPDAALRIRARMYRSRHATLRTVRIAGSGEVWVDGVSVRTRYHTTMLGPFAQRMLLYAADLLEPRAMSAAIRADRKQRKAKRC